MKNNIKRSLHIIKKASLQEDTLYELKFPTEVYKGGDVCLEECPDRDCILPSNNVMAQLFNKEQTTEQLLKKLHL